MCMCILFFHREVFKAKDKKTNKKFVAMKKVLMDNEKEGVSLLYIIYSISFNLIL